MLSCSFCGRKADQTAALLAGLGVNICDRCVTTSVRTIATRDALEEAPVRAEELSSIDDELLLSQLAAVSELLDKQSERLKAQVGEVRRRGLGWHVIGASLGVSGEVAEHRFGSR